MANRTMPKYKDSNKSIRIKVDKIIMFSFIRIYLVLKLKNNITFLLKKAMKCV